MVLSQERLWGRWCQREAPCTCVRKERDDLGADLGAAGVDARHGIRPGSMTTCWAAATNFPDGQDWPGDRRGRARGPGIEVGPVAIAHSKAIRQLPRGVPWRSGGQEAEGTQAAAETVNNRSVSTQFHLCSRAETRVSSMASDWLIRGWSAARCGGRIPWPMCSAIPPGFVLLAGLA